MQEWAKTYIKLLRVRIKKLKHRKYVIQELITTEEQYCKSLSIILNEVKLPALEKNFLKKEEANQIFSDLDEIQNFHKFFSTKLRAFFDTFDNRQSKIGEIILKVIPVFKMYFIYCDNFKNANVRLEQMRKENHPFINFIKPLEFNPTLQNLDLISQLVKPVQRLPKYVLLFKDLKKNTDEKHPDYQNISKCLEEFSKINEQNNAKVNEHLKTRKILELDKKFGSEVLPIVKEARYFIEEEPLNILEDETLKPVIGFFLSDLLLIVDESQNQLLKFIEFDRDSFVKDVPDTKYFKCLFRVTGKDGKTVTINSDSLQTKKKLKSFIEDILTDIKEKVFAREKAKEKDIFSVFPSTQKLDKNSKFSLTVIGSTKRGIQNFKPVTMYIVQMNLGNFISKFYYRFSELLKLNEMINQQFPDLKIENLPKKHWWRSQKTKIIESRKLLIEGFLHSIFFRSELNQNPEILNVLSLADNNLTVFSEIFMEKNEELNKKILVDLLEKEKILGKTSIFSYIFRNCDYYNLFSKGSFLLSSELQGFDNAPKIKIRLMNNEYVSISINKHTKAFEACLEISKHLNLISHLDFKLYLSNSEDERMIENEEFLWQILDYNPNTINEEMLFEMLQHEKKQGVFSGMTETIYNQYHKLKKNWEDLCFCKYELVFKKYMFFPTDWEQRDLKRDSMRLNLLASQIFSENLNSKYELSFEEYSLVAGLQCFINHGNFDDKKEYDPYLFDRMRIFIPKLAIYLKTKNFWIDQIIHYWKKFTAEIEETRLNNHNYNNKLAGFYHKRPKIETSESIASFICFNFFKKLENFGQKLFWVTAKKNPKGLQKIFDNFLWIGITYKHLVLLTPEEKKEIVSMDMEKIKNVAGFPSSFSFWYEEKEYSFYSNSSHEICSMIQEYAKLALDVSNRICLLNIK